MNTVNQQIEDLIDMCGGSANLARRVGVSPSAVRLWKMRNLLPKGRVVEILGEADRVGVKLEPRAFGLDKFGDIGY